MKIQLCRVLALVVILLFTGSARALSCKLESKVCVDSTEPKMVSGLPVYFADVGITDSCWDWQNTYSCSSQDNVNYCAAFESSGACSKVNSVCAKASPDNPANCELYTNTYRCGSLTTEATSTVVVDYSHTLVRDNQEYQQCATPSDNQSCVVAADKCIEGAATKVALADGSYRLATDVEVAQGSSPDGQLKYQQCWAWQNDYACSAGIYKNYCDPLKAAGCTESQAATCVVQRADGTCTEYERTYACGDTAQIPPENVIKINTGFVASSADSTTTCSVYSGNPSCSKVSETCVDGPSTKVVLPDGSTRAATDAEVASGTSTDGAVVYRACWVTESRYNCTSTVQTSNCDQLQGKPECSYASSGCVAYFEDGTCSVMQHIYRCKKTEDTTETVTDCGTQKFCADGACFDTGYTPDKDFTLAITSLELTREAGSYDLFKGEMSKCDKKLWGLANCCDDQPGGGKYSNASIAQQMGVSAIQYGGEKVLQVGSQYLFDALMANGVDHLSSMAFDATAAVMESSMANPTFTMGAYGFSIGPAGAAGSGLMGATTSLSQIGSTNMYLYFNPYALVAAVFIAVVMDYMSCDEDEIKFGIRKGVGLCHRVGSYCSNEILGSCETKTEGWCCWPSKLGRIVNEQGRPQIGKTWGTGKNPDCSGFTETELMQLRFDEMDLSEFFSSIPKNVKYPDMAVQRLQERASAPEPKSYYELSPSVAPGTVNPVLGQ